MDPKDEAFEKAINTIKIELSDQEKVALHDQLGRFQKWLELMEMAETEGSDLHYFGCSVENNMREDRPLESDLEEIRKEAVEFEDGFYLVPRIID
jgi:aspartyl/glutamyl-tRNA(Asn/Gln) amidotransferase C subunit